MSGLAAPSGERLFWRAWRPPGIKRALSMQSFVFPRELAASTWGFLLLCLSVGNNSPVGTGEHEPSLELLACVRGKCEET